MAQAQYAPLHTVNPETGYIESKSYPFAFDSPRKQQFISCLVQNGLGIYEACEAMGISHHTLFKHYHNDPEFKADLDAARNEYGARLDSISKRNAMNPKSVIERIFQLKSIFPERYADQRREQSLNISITIDPQLLSKVKDRDKVIEAQAIPDNSPITSTPILARESTVLTKQNVDNIDNFGT